MKSSTPESWSNVEFFEEKNYLIFHINPNVYSLEVVFSAAYFLLDKAYVIIDGNPKEEILVRIASQEKDTLKELAKLFNDELINYAVYINESKRTLQLREALVKRAFSIHSTSTKGEPKEDSKQYINDPNGISKPWGENK